MIFTWFQRKIWIEDGFQPTKMRDLKPEKSMKIWISAKLWGVPNPPRRLGEKADGLCAEGNHCHPVWGNGELGELEALGVHIPHSGPMEFSNHIIYIYIYHEWTGIISPRHGKANDAWGEVPPKSIDFRLANEYNAARLHSTMWILISPTCGYGPAIQYPMISLLVVPFGPSNLSISSPWEAGGCEWTVVWEDMGMPLYLATLLVDCHNPGTPCYYNWSSFSLKPIHSYLFGGVPEIWVPQTMVFLIDNNHFGMFWGTHISGNPSINKPSINHP